MSVGVGLAWILWAVCAHHVIAAEPTADSLAGTLVGTVLDAEGASLDSFTLTVYKRGNEPQIHRFEGAERHFRVDVGVGGFGIALDAPGRATWFDAVSFNSNSGGHELGTVRIQRGRTVSGRITDARDGSPIAGAVIRYEPTALSVLAIDVAEEYPLGWWTTTDRDGGFALSRLPENRVRLEVLSEEYVTRAVVLPAGKDRLDIELGGGAMIEGMMSLADGTPVDGTVWVQLDTDGSRALERQVDPDGRFRFEGLAVGSYRLAARSSAGLVERRSLTLAKDERASVDLLADPLGCLTGSISGLRESERASIFIWSADEWRNLVRRGQSEFGNGRFVVHGIPDGDHVAEVTARMDWDSRTLTREIEMVGGEATADFSFAGRSRIKGRVLAGSRPVRAVMVHAVPRDPALPSAGDMSDVDGEYEIPGLGDGEYDLRAQLGPRGTHRSFDVAVVADTTFDIRLGSFALSGAVVLEADHPFRLAHPREGRNEANWVVQARLVSASAEPVIFRGFTDSRGAFRFDGLEEGEYRVSFASPYIGGIHAVVVDGSSVESVNIRPTISDTRSVRVVDAHTKESLNDVSCEVQDGVWAGSPVYDLENGLPTTLFDANLTCSRKGYETVHIRWDGKPLEINLAPRHP